MADTLTRATSDWDTLDAFKFIDEEAYLETLLEDAPLKETLRMAAVRRGR